MVSGAKVKEVTFYWSTEHGRCQDCGRPAAFRAPDAYGVGQEGPKLCSVCAATHAADGERITWIVDPLAEEES